MKQKTNYQLPPTNYQSGFTLIELFFVSIFVMVISLYVVGNLNKIRTAQELENTAFDLISKIRSTQSSVLAGKIIAGQAVPPEAYDERFSENSASYQIFSVVRTSPTQTSTTSLETVSLGSQVLIQDITIDGSGVSGTVSLVTVSPFGRIYVCQGTSCAYNRILRLSLEHLRTNEILTVVVDGISGRITVE